MKNIGNSDIHGFVDSDLDGNIRARTVDGDIVKFSMNDKVLEASLQDQKLTIPEEIRNTTRPINLLQLLKVYTIKVSDGKLKIAPIAKTIDGEAVTFDINDKETEVMIKGQKVTAPAELNKATNLKDLLITLSNNAIKVNEGKIQLIPVERKTVSAPNPVNSANSSGAEACTTYGIRGADGACAGKACTAYGICGADGACAGRACAAYGICGVDAACLGRACAAYGVCAVDGACAGHVCAAYGACGADGACAGKGCAADGVCGADGACAGKACAGKVACGVDGGCAGQVCAGQICGVDGACAGDAHVGPCIHIPYCPIIF